MELALDTAGTEEYGHARLTGTVSVSFTNDSSDVWEQVCLRDYVPAILAEDLASSGETDAIGYLSSGIAAVREGITPVLHPGDRSHCDFCGPGGAYAAR